MQIKEQEMYSLKRLHGGRLQTCHPLLNLRTARLHVSQIASSAGPGRVFMRTDNACCFTVECLQAEGGRVGGTEEGKGVAGWEVEKSKQNKLIKDASNPETPGVTSLAGYTDLENNNNRETEAETKRGARVREKGEEWESSGEAAAAVVA